MSLRNMLRDRVALVKQDGRRFEDLRASVQSDMIITDDDKLPIEESDTFERMLPSGLLESYTIIDRGFMKGMGSIRSHYQSKVRKSPSKMERSAMAKSRESTAPILKLFVSHSSKDVELVRLLVTLLRSALNLSAKEIRCTSVDGYRLPGGADTVEQLRREVHDAQAFVGVISAASLESMYVTFELGARWGAQKHLLPILTPGADPSILSGPLSGINALRCDNAAQIHQLINDLGTELAVKVEPASVYQLQIDEILQYSQVHKAGTVSEDAGISEGTMAESPISELEFSILVAVGKRQRASVSDVASAVNVNEEKAKFYLDELSRKHELIEWVGNMNPSIPVYYKLNHEGRKLLVERGVFD